MIQELLSNWKTAVAFNRQEKEVDRLDQFLKKPQELGIVKMILSGTSQGVVFLILYSMVGIAFWFGNSDIVAQQGGTIMQIIICILIAAMALANAFPNFEIILKSYHAACTIFAIIDEPSKIDNFDSTGFWIESLNGDISFENVTFAYPSQSDKLVLENLYLNIPRGKTLALVGDTGCGKSTIVQLLLRFYDVNGGKVTIDNTDIRDFNVRWIRQQIGFVNQEPVLFNTTIKDNIQMGAVDQSTVPDENIVKVCRLTHAHDFIVRLPEGYDTVVGEGGVQLSAGQKQRIAIARALISNPRILVLDEATSALDVNNEALVQEALDKARLGRTTIVISHRLATIKNADLIAVISDGQVTEIGSHDQLLEEEGYYFQLVERHRLMTEAGNESPLNTSELDMTNELLYATAEEETLANQSMKANDSLLTKTEIISKNPSFKRLNSNNSASRSRSGSKIIDARRRPSLGMVHLERGEPEDAPKIKMKRFKRFYLMKTVLTWGKHELFLTVLCVLVSILVGGIQPSYGIIMSEFMSSFCPGNTHSKFNFLLGLIIVLGLVQALLVILQHFLFGLIGEKLTKRMRGKVFGKILRMDADWHEKEENNISCLNSIITNDCVSIQGVGV